MYQRRRKPREGSKHRSLTAWPQGVRRRSRPSARPSAGRYKRTLNVIVLARRRAETLLEERFDRRTTTMASRLHCALGGGEDHQKEAQSCRTTRRRRAPSRSRRAFARGRGPRARSEGRPFRGARRPWWPAPSTRRCRPAIPSAGSWAEGASEAVESGIVVVSQRDASRARKARDGVLPVRRAGLTPTDDADLARNRGFVPKQPLNVVRLTRP